MNRDKKDRDRKRNESDSPTAVRVRTFPTDAVGSTMAREEVWWIVVWFVTVGLADQPKYVTVGNKESHESDCAFRTGEQ